MSKENRMYAVMIGDLIDSKKIEQRELLQEKFASGLERISKRENGIVSPFTITLGDEFQAVFETGSGLLQSLFEVRSILYPVECRFSLGIGELKTRINTKQAIGMDGPAFHLARDGIKLLKESDRRLALSGFESTTSWPMKSMVDLLWESTSKWNGHRLKIMTGLFDGKREKELAKMLGISERSIYKNIKEAQLLTWKELIERVEENITEFLGR